MAPLILTRAILLVALICAFAAPVRAQDNLRMVEQDIKAGLIYNFLRYTEWPGRPASNVVVCIYGRDPFAGRLGPMSGRTVNQRAIEVRTVNDFAQTNACALLYVSADERTRWPQLRAHLAGADVLTVSDFEGFAASGGMIEFTRVERRVGVRINRRAVDAAHIVVQDRLLRLASAVDGGGR